MKVLIILASYNGEKYIKEQINSILAQDGVEIEIVVFDDRSTDKTIEIVKGFDDLRISVNINLKSTGSAALNFLNAIKSITIDRFLEFSFVGFADQDDIWFSNKVIDACNLLRVNNSSLYCSNLYVWEQSSDNKFLLKKDFEQRKFDFLFEGGSAGCTYLMSTNFIINFKNYLDLVKINNWNYLSHDWLIYFYARINNFKVIIDSNPKILYRIHENNVHGQLNINSFLSFKKRFKFVYNGWYFNHVDHFILLTSHNSLEHKIYDYYNFNWFTRVYILVRYNFDLIRSKNKFIQFFLVSLLPRVKI